MRERPKSFVVDDFDLNMITLLNMTSFNLYPLAGRCKHVRCHVQKIVGAVAGKSGSVSQNHPNSPRKASL
jgi:hypothetical protein